MRQSILHLQMHCRVIPNITSPQCSPFARPALLERAAKTRSLCPHLQRRLLAARVSAQSRNSSARIQNAKPRPAGRAPGDYMDSSSSLAHSLLNRSTPTLLYQAPNSNAYKMTCYGIGCFCIAYGVWNFNDAVLEARPGLFWIIPWFMGGVCLFMTGAGVYVLRNATNLVLSVSALPVTRTAGGATGAIGKDLSVQIRTDNFIPFLSGRTISLPIEQVSLAKSIRETRAYSIEAHSSRYQANEATRRRMEALEQRAAREKELEEKFNPLRHFVLSIGRGLNALLSSFRRIVSREGFVKMYVQEGNSTRTCRLDVHDGWLLDNGSALERLIRTKA